MDTKLGQSGSLTNKTIAEIEHRIETLKVENDFYSNGVTFSSVEAYSANHLFGNGKWKKTCMDAFGEDVFFNNCDKYGNKPIDFKITLLKTQYAKYFSPGQAIEVKDNDGAYTGKYKCMGVVDGGIAIMALPKVSTSGFIVNVSQKRGTENALKKHYQMLEDLKPSVKKSEFEDEPKGAIDNMIPFISDEMRDKWKQEAQKEKRNKNIKTIAIIGGILVLIIMAYAFYKYKTKNK